MGRHFSGDHSGRGAKLTSSFMEKLNRYLDAAILKPETTRAEAIDAIKACIQLEVFSVCVRPSDIELAKSLVKGTSTAVCVVLGFPHGNQLTESKSDEALRYIALGVDEIDMVANYGLVRSGEWAMVASDIEAVAAPCKAAGISLKVIFETTHLDIEAIRHLVGICIKAGADFVKTSTGFGGGGATDEAVQTMVATAAGRIKIKPSGGIRDRERAIALIEMGTHRLGVNWSSCEAICTGAASAGNAGSY